MRAMLTLGDVTIGGDAGDQDRRLALGIEQVAHMAGMDDIKDAVAHDHALLTRRRAKDVAQLPRRLDLVLVARDHGCFHATPSPEPSAPRCSNHTAVARAIESGSHNGASRQW